MDVIINEIVSTIKLSPVMDQQVAENIVRLCLTATKAHREHEDRVHQERCVTGGVRDEIEGVA
jgi:hypothetical protein